MNLGNSSPDNILEERLKKQAVNQCCTLIYTVQQQTAPFFLFFFCDNKSYSFVSSPFTVWNDGQSERRHAQSRQPDVDFPQLGNIHERT